MDRPCCKSCEYLLYSEDADEYFCDNPESLNYGDNAFLEDYCDSYAYKPSVDFFKGPKKRFSRSRQGEYRRKY